MRDLALARKQLVSGIIYALATGALLFFVTKPQYQQFQQRQSQPLVQQLQQLSSLNALPVLAFGTPMDWDKHVLNKFTEAGTKAAVVIVGIQRGKSTPINLSTDSSGVEAIPVMITLTGTYPGIRRFLDQLNLLLPTARIRGIQIKLMNTPSNKPNESPMVEGILRLELMAFVT